MKANGTWNTVTFVRGCTSEAGHGSVRPRAPSPPFTRPFCRPSPHGEDNSHTRTPWTRPTTPRTQCRTIRIRVRQNYPHPQGSAIPAHNLLSSFSEATEVRHTTTPPLLTPPHPTPHTTHHTAHHSSHHSSHMQTEDTRVRVWGWRFVAGLSVAVCVRPSRCVRHSVHRPVPCRAGPVLCVSRAGDP